MPAERLKLRPPSEGHKIVIAEGRLKVPDDPILPIIEGDGIGPDVTKAARRAISAAVERTSGGRRKIVWYDVPAGEMALFKYGELLPQATFDAIREYVVAIKGPLTTPIGGGFRSLNVALRQGLDLYANVRPVYWIPGVPSPVKHPERMNIVIFREATEDVYAGIEWEKGSDDAGKLRKFLETEFRVKIPEDAGIGLKPISERKSKRLVRKAIRHAIENHRRSVALVHKGNIMKFTEGAFCEWGYEVARDEFPKETITLDELNRSYGGGPPEGEGVVKDGIADKNVPQLPTRTEGYDVLATPKPNGGYLH